MGAETFGCKAPTEILSGDFFSRKANPSASAIINGKKKTQKTAPGSRKNARMRALTSSASGEPNCLLISQFPAGQRHEDVLQGGTVGRKRHELRFRVLDGGKQRGHGLNQRVPTH